MDRFDVRSVFTFTIGIFTLASVLYGFSQSLSKVTLLRILPKRIGGAMMVLMGRLIVLRTTHKKAVD